MIMRAVAGLNQAPLLTAGQIASPSAAILAQTNVIFAGPNGFFWVVNPAGTGLQPLPAPVQGFSKATSLRRQDRATFAQRPALIQAPAWGAAATVAVGDVVRLPNGQLILCMAQTGVTGGTAPAFSATTPITDNLVTWYSMGRNSRLASGYDIPTITTSSSTPAGCTSYAWNNGANVIQNVSGIVSFPTNNTTPVGVSNVYMVQDNFYNDGSTNQTNGLAGGLRNYAQVFETICDSAIFAVSTWNNNSDPLCYVYVGDPDGSNMILVEEMPTKMVSGNPCFYVMTWANQKRRRYRFELRSPNAGSFTNIVGLAYPATAAIQAPTVDGLTGLHINDSYGVTTSPQAAQYDPAEDRFGLNSLKYAGVRFVQLTQSEGAGYVASPSPTFGLNTSRVSVPLMLANNNFGGKQFDVVLFACGLNDSPFTQTQTQAGALQSFQRIRTLMPNAFIIAAGPQDAGNNRNAAILAVEAGIKAAILQFADANSAFFTTLNDGPNGNLAWVYGTGKVGSTTGDGNADYYLGADGTHPPVWGHEYLSQRVAIAVDAILTAAGR